MWHRFLSAVRSLLLEDRRLVELEQKLSDAQSLIEALRDQLTIKTEEHARALLAAAESRLSETRTLCDWLAVGKGMPPMFDPVGLQEWRRRQEELEEKVRTQALVDEAGGLDGGAGTFEDVAMQNFFYAQRPVQGVGTGNGQKYGMDLDAEVAALTREMSNGGGLT